MEQTLTFYPINNTMMAFRFQSFRFLGHYAFIYLHCRAYSCAITDNGAHCNQNCRASSSRARRRRDLSGTAVEYQVDSGSIVAVEYSEVAVQLSASNGKLVLYSLGLNCQERAEVSEEAEGMGLKREYVYLEGISVIRGV